jgi:hypothetical protein
MPRQRVELIQRRGVQVHGAAGDAAPADAPAAAPPYLKHSVDTA